MQTTYHCPSCYGRIRDADDGGRLVECPYCGRHVLPQATNSEPAPVAGPKDQQTVNNMAVNLEKIKQLMKAGNKAAAIDLYRQLFGVSHSQAKSGLRELMKNEKPESRSWLSRLFGGK
jgi:DNA-directed RNA polymerase subunit RPC12/RpoP